jgi:hypothetical protein
MTSFVEPQKTKVVETHVTFWYLDVATQTMMVSQQSGVGVVQVARPLQLQQVAHREVLCYILPVL